jgi:hypothetical protein
MDRLFLCAPGESGRVIEKLNVPMDSVADADSNLFVPIRSVFD